MEYVKDKWYEINNGWYARYNKTIYNNWYYLESITTNGKYQRNHNGANIDVKNDIKLLESLQEIQKWLPDDHPQKITPVIQETKEQQLLEEAKRRYPPDTLFKLAHLNGATGVIRPKYSFKYEKGHDNRDYLYVTNNNIVVNDKDGMSYCVYIGGKWAEIVEDKWIPKIGEYIYITMPNYTPFTNTVRKIVKLHPDGDHFYCESLGLFQDFEQCFSLKNNHFRKALPHEIPNQSLVGRYYQRLHYSISSVQEGDYLRCYAEDNSAVWLDKYGYLSKDDINIHWKLMPEGFNPYLLDNFEIKLDYGAKGEEYKIYDTDNSFKIKLDEKWFDYPLSNKEFYDKYWVVKGVKSKKQLVIGTVQKPILLNNKKNKFQLI